MIVKGIILIILIFGALVFLAIKMSESIVKAELKMFFFGLFFVTIITVFNILLSVYFIIKAKDKTGPRGRKGLKGTIGEPGDDGICQESCKKNSIHQMIIKQLDNDENNLNETEMKQLCYLKKEIDLENSQLDNSKLNELDGLQNFYGKLNGITYEQGILNNFNGNFNNKFNNLELKDKGDNLILNLVSQQSCN